MESIGLLLKVLWAPGEAMFQIAKKAPILVPLAALCLFSIAPAAVMSLKKIDQGELTIRMMERARRGAELPEQMKAAIKTQSNSPTQFAIGVVAAVVFPIILVAFVAVLYFGLFTVFGRDGGYKAFFAVTAFACLPFIFRNLVTILTFFVVPQSDIMLEELGSLSPAVFLDRAAVSPVLFAAVGMVDIITIWILSLLVIGFKFLTTKGVSTGTRAFVVVGVYMVYALGRLSIAYLTGF